MFIKYKKGFTLVELMVTISIATILLSTILFNYNSFIDRLSLTSAAQELAITIRQAQTYGLVVKEAVAGGGQFDASYGVYFNTDDTSHYYLFVDKNKDGLYTVGNGCGGNNTECIEMVTMRDRILISSICNDTVCPPVNAKKLYVTFLRPNPEAIIKFYDSANGLLSSSNTGKVVLVSPKNTQSTVIIEKAGQVTVQ